MAFNVALIISGAVVFVMTLRDEYFAGVWRWAALVATGLAVGVPVGVMVFAGAGPLDGMLESGWWAGARGVLWAGVAVVPVGRAAALAPLSPGGKRLVLSGGLGVVAAVLALYVVNVVEPGELFALRAAGGCQLPC